jgi:hypothetical protein
MGFNIEQYESFLSKNTNDFSNLNSWSNVTGDVNDLQSKLAEYQQKEAYFAAEALNAQMRYDEANARYCADRCGKGKNAPCHGACWSKERDKNSNYSTLVNFGAEKVRYADLVNKTKNDLATEIKRVYDAEQIRLANEATERARLAVIEQKRLEDAAAKVISDAAIASAAKTAQDLADAQQKALDIKKEIDLKLVEKGVVPEAELKKAELAGQAVIEASKVNATAQAKVTELAGASAISNKKYLIIGGFVVIAIGAFLFLRKNN